MTKYADSNQADNSHVSLDCRFSDSTGECTKKHLIAKLLYLFGGTWIICTRRCAGEGGGPGRTEHFCPDLLLPFIQIVWYRLRSSVTIYTGARKSKIVVWLNTIHLILFYFYINLRNAKNSPVVEELWEDCFLIPVLFTLLFPLPLLIH